MLKIKRIINNIKLRPGLRQASFLKLACQTIPYYFSGNGYSKNPLTVYFSVNSVCNLSCHMCDVGQKKTNSNFAQNMIRDNKYLDLKVIKKVIDEIKFYQPLISFNSVEPLLYKKLFEAIEYCSKNNLKTQIITNGYLLENFADEIKKSGLTEITISVDGPEKIHNAIRGKDDSYQKIINGLNKLSSFFENIYINITISELNYDSLINTITDLKQYPIKGFLIYFPNFIDETMTNNFEYSHNMNFKTINLEILNNMLNNIREKFDNVAILPDLSNYSDINDYFFNPLQPIKSGGCMAPWGVVQILADGEVVPITRCFAKSFGNIYSEKILDIWNNDKFRNFRKKLRKNKRYPICSRCCGLF